MISFDNKVSVYSKVNGMNDAVEEIPLWKVLMRVTSGKYKELVERIRKEHDEAMQKKLKMMLPCFTPSGTFADRTSASLKEYSGFICIDIDEQDHKDDKNFCKVKEILSKIPYVAYCAVSCRGRGYWALIPVADASKHKEYYTAMCRALDAIGIHADRSCADVGRKRFVTYDAEPYINTGAKVFDVVLKEYKPVNSAGTCENISEETRKKVDYLISTIEENGIDVCGGYEHWFRMLCSIAHAFGEDGRTYAHSLSEQGAKYKSPADVDKYFNDALKYKSKEPVTIATFIRDAQEGIKNYQIQKDFSHITNQ